MLNEIYSSADQKWLIENHEAVKGLIAKIRASTHDALKQATETLDIVLPKYKE